MDLDANQLTAPELLQIASGLAAAHAEAGRFEEAVRYQTRALDDPTLQGDLRTAARQRLELYQQEKAFRETGP